MIKKEFNRLQIDKIKNIKMLQVESLNTMVTSVPCGTLDDLRQHC